ncbi:MAG: hypothetical protein LBR11_03075, partial [Deltaproteobacteria bacterium]|nr:hypothetical protein [Deltaproteobacteria bacterium]
MSIKFKIILGFISVCCIFLILCGFLTYEFIIIKEETDDLRNIVITGNYNAKFLNYSLTMDNLKIYDYTLFKKEE